tara:strand:+ start:540 stop:641 length:102 start_codon:yes stop_codon:yes gene_type:complete
MMGEELKASVEIFDLIAKNRNTLGWDRIIAMVI